MNEYILALVVGIIIVIVFVALIKLASKGAIK